MANVAFDISAPAPLQPRRSSRSEGPPFAGLLDPIILADPVEFAFPGAISEAQALGIWTWVRRHIAPDLFGDEHPEEITHEAIEPVLGEIQKRLQAALASSDPAARRQIQILLSGEDGLERVRFVATALRYRALIEKARTFGRAANAISDDGALQGALQSMPISEGATGAILCQAMLGEVANPGRLVLAATKIAGDGSEAALQRAGMGPLIEAVLAHAQNQLPGFSQNGPFADFDLVCRSVERFHRLMRAISTNVELSRNGRWANIVRRLTKRASERIEPKLRRVMQQLHECMRPREGENRIDSDAILAALSCLYLLVTVRECRESLALNAMFERVWNQAGQALEFHLTRNIDMLRADPSNAVVAARVEAGIKMAELRFNINYADVLRRARDAAGRRGV